MSEVQMMVTQSPIPVSATDEAAAIRASIKLSDTAQIVIFGEKAQRDVASFADQILQQTRGRDLGDTNHLLSDLMAKAKGLDVADLKKANPIMRMVGGFRRQMSRFKAQFETVAQEIDAISAQLQVRLDRMRADLQMLDGLHDQARLSISTLDLFIGAGKSYADDFRANQLPKLMVAADVPTSDASQSLMNAQAYQDATQALDRLEKRIYTLQQARQIAIQQLPQIRIVQNGDAALIESLGASINLTIPAWKQKMVLLLGLERQREALAMQKAVTETTNELIRRTSELLKVQASEIEQESQRGVVDLEVLGDANRQLIETIEGVLKLQEKGRQTRAAAEIELARQTSELKNAIVATKPQPQLS